MTTIMQTEYLVKLLTYFLATAWGWAMSFVLPVHQFMALTFALVLSDVVTGVWAAYKRNEAIRSNGFRRTISKIVLYFLAILLSKGMEDVLHIPKLIYIVSGFIAMTEFKSNLENIAVVTGTNIWAHLVERIPGIFKLPKGKGNG